MHLFKPGPLKNCPRVPLWSLVSLYLLWHLIHILSKEKFLNLSPNLEGIGCAAQGRFDMACAQKGSMSDAFRLTANGQLAQLYKQVHSTDFQVCLNSSLAVHTLYNILANCLAACIPLCICISCPIVLLKTCGLVESHRQITGIVMSFVLYMWHNFKLNGIMQDVYVMHWLTILELNSLEKITG